jgi:hypothetical protein
MHLNIFALKNHIVMRGSGVEWMAEIIEKRAKKGLGICS